MNETNGVTITTREIYESVNNLVREVNRLGVRFDKLEDNITSQKEIANEVKKKSYEALSLANDANKSASEASKDAESALEKIEQVTQQRYKDKIEQNDKEKDTRSKFYIAVASASIPWIITIIVGVIYVAKNGGL